MCGPDNPLDRVWLSVLEEIRPEPSPFLGIHATAEFTFGSIGH